MRPSRGEKEKNSTLSLARTGATAMMIASIMTFVAMFYPLFEAAKKLTLEDPVSYYLPWCLAYGVIALGFSTYSIIALVEMGSRPIWIKPMSVVAMICGVILFLSGFPIGILLKTTEFMISVFVIAVCVFAIGLLTLKSYQEEFRR